MIKKPRDFHPWAFLVNDGISVKEFYGTECIRYTMSHND
jgi:hypothetical protein